MYFTATLFSVSVLLIPTNLNLKHTFQQKEN